MKVYVNTNNQGTLNLRAKPSLSSSILAQIPYKTELETEETSGEWSKVTYEGKTGYVMNKYLGSLDTISREKLLQIYNSLKATLSTIESVLK